MLLLKDKVAVVTGGGSGIGKAIAAAFVQEGCSVVIASRTAERLREAARELTAAPSDAPGEARGGRGKCVAHVTDVRDEGSVRDLFRETMSLFGRLDILVNNAGLVRGGQIGDLDARTFREVMDVNVTGVFLCTSEAFRIMRERGGGRIINIGSLASRRGRMSSAPYTTSKHAVWGLTQCAALDGRRYGISCGQLDPGNTAVERRLAAGGRTASGVDEGPEPMIAVEDVARAALYMATLPPQANALELTVLPVAQPYIGRG